MSSSSMASFANTNHLFYVAFCNFYILSIHSDQPDGIAGSYRDVQQLTKRSYGSPLPMSRGTSPIPMSASLSLSVANGVAPGDGHLS
jgi:hypothetical protein